MTNVLQAPKYIGFIIKPNFIRLVGLNLRTTTKSAIKIPKSRCEYVLSKRDDKSGPEITFRRPGHDDFTVIMKYQEHVLTIKPKTSVITIDGKVAEKETSIKLVPMLLEVIIHKDLFTVLNPFVTWVTEIKRNHQLFTSLTNYKMSGIGWQSFEKDLTASDLLKLFEPFKTDPFCEP